MSARHELMEEVYRGERSARKQAVEFGRKRLALYLRKGWSRADAENSVLCDAGRINIFTQRAIQKALGYRFKASQDGPEVGEQDED